MAIGELERRSGEIYPRLDWLGAELAESLRQGAADAGLPIVVNQVGSAAHAFISDRRIEDYADALAADAPAYWQFAEALLRRGIHITPKGLLYVSTVHDDADLMYTREAVREAVLDLSPDGRLRAGP